MDARSLSQLDPGNTAVTAMVTRLERLNAGNVTHHKHVYANTCNMTCIMSANYKQSTVIFGVNVYVFVENVSYFSLHKFQCHFLDL